MDLEEKKKTITTITCKSEQNLVDLMAQEKNLERVKLNDFSH